MAASTQGKGSGGSGGGLSPSELVLLVFVGAVAVYLGRELLAAWKPDTAGARDQAADVGDRLLGVVAPVAIILVVAIALWLIARQIRRRREYLRRHYAAAVRLAMPRTFKSSQLQVRRWFALRPRKITVDLAPECNIEESAWRERVVAQLAKGVGEPLSARWPGHNAPVLRAQPRVVLRPQRKGLLARIIAARR